MKSETFLIGDLRRQILLYPKGRETVYNLSVSLDVEGGSELPLGWSRCAQFSLIMVNQLQRSKSITKGSLFAIVYFTFFCGVFFLLSCHSMISLQM